MKTSSSTRTVALPAAALVVAAGGVLSATIFWVAGGYAATAPLLGFADPQLELITSAIRVVQLVGTWVLAGLALSRPLVKEPTRGVRIAALVAAIIVAVSSELAAYRGQAATPLVLTQLVLALAVPVLLSRGRIVALAGAGLVGVLAWELSRGQVLLPAALFVLYALSGAVLVGVTVLGVSANPRRTADLRHTADLRRRRPPVRLEAADPTPDDGADPIADGADPTPDVDTDPVADSDAELDATRNRLTRAALASGVLAAAVGVSLLLAVGPNTVGDLFGTGYGLALSAVAVVPILVTLTWFLTTRPAGGPRAGELNRLAVGGLVLSFAATSALGLLPLPPAGPHAGQPLLRPLTLGFRHLAVLVTPMRPGPNLVHIGDANDANGLPPRHHAATAPVLIGTVTVSVGNGTGDTARQVPVTARDGASGGWAVIDIPAGSSSLTVTADGVPGAVPISVGSKPTEGSDTLTQQALVGPDGPECVSAALGALAAGAGVSGRPDVPGSPGAKCPSEELTGADAATLTDFVVFLRNRGVSGVTVVADDSPRSRAADQVVRAEAARRGLPISAVPSPTDGLMVLTGWTKAADTVRRANAKGPDAPPSAQGIFLAPWLLTPPVMTLSETSVLGLQFNPQDIDSLGYASTLVGVFPKETPSAAGYRAWAQQLGVHVDPRASFYSGAPINVPMGPDNQEHGSNPAAWFPSGAIIQVSPPMGSPTP